MKIVVKISVLVVLLVIAPSHCFADWSITPVSTERAKELGLEVRSQAAGPDDVWVNLEFKPEGKFKSFSQVNLRIGDGKKNFFSIPLREKRSREGSVTVSFTADRTRLEKLTLWVMVADAVPGGTAYELRVKDFVDLEKLR